MPLSKISDEDLFFIMAGGSLPSYCGLNFPDLKLEKHHEVVSKTLMQLEAGDINRLMIFMPPRHGKTMLASEYFPAWYMGRNPEKQIIFSTYSQDRALDVGRKVRNQLDDPMHKRIFGLCALSTDSTAANRFNTKQGGSFFAVGSGGAITGRGAHLFLIDDPIKDAEEAASQTQRDKLKDWYGQVAYTRLMPGGAIIIIQTRWHCDDLAGWILREHQHEDWTVLSLPALAESNDLLGREEGEALWPEQYPKERLLEIKKTIGVKAFSALYQQRPVPEGGNIFKLEWFKYFGRAPEFSLKIQSWDTAFKDTKESAYSAGGTFGQTDTGYYLLDVLRHKLEYPDLKRAIVSEYQKHMPHVVLVEDKASGQSIVQELKRETTIPIIAVKPKKGDKELRATLVSPIVESGSFYLPQSAPWLNDYLDELLHFPAGEYADMVDMTSQGLDYLSQKKGRTISGAVLMGGRQTQ